MSFSLVNRVLVGLCSAAALASSALGQSTDACSAANTVGEGTFPWSLIGATNDGFSVCNPAATYDVWYRYVPSQSGHAIVSTCFSQYSQNTIVSVVDQCPFGNALNSCFYNNGLAIPYPYCIAYNTVRFPVIAGQSYYVRLAENAPDLSPPPFPRTVHIAIDHGNDDCSAPFPVGPGDTAFDTTNASDSWNSGPSCNRPGRDKWYSYTAPCNGIVDVSIPCWQASFATVLGAYTSCNSSSIACSQSSCPFINGTGSHITFNVTGGQTYLIRVDGATANDFGMGTFNLTFTQTSPPLIHDECTGAIAIGPGITTFNTGCFTSSVGSTPLTNAAGPDAWFAYTATVNGVAEVKTCGLTAFNTVLSEYATCAGNPISNDNYCGLQSRIAFYITAGNAYLLQVDGATSADYGPGAITITEVPVTAARPPINDTCEDAVDVRAGSFAFSTQLATGDGTPSCVGTAGGPDVYFRYTSATTGIATIDTCGPDRTFDTILSAFTSCGGTQLACDNDSCGQGSRITFAVEAGVPVLIRAAGFAGESGTASLAIIDPVGDPCSRNRACIADVDDGSGGGTPDDGVTIDDLLYYLVIFEAGGPCADVDDGGGTGTRDGGVTIDDLLYYLFRFEAGC